MFSTPVRSCGLVVAVLFVMFGCAANAKSAPHSASRELFLSIDSWKGLAFEVNVRGTEVLYQCSRGADRLYSARRRRWATLRVEPSEAQQLFDDLVALGMLDLEPSYETDMLDGEGWSLAAQVGEHGVEAYGSNAQPDVLQPIVERIARFVAPYPFGFSGCVPDPPEDCRLFSGKLRSHVCTSE